MLPAQARLRRSPDFAATVRAGRRAGHPAMVVAVLRPGHNGHLAPEDAPARVGFVVGRRIGGAVVRNRVRRRLQHLLAERLHRLPAGSRTVIRALPGAEKLKYPELAHTLDRLLSQAIR